MPNLSNVNVTITATDRTGPATASAINNLSRLSSKFSGIGTIASGVFGGILGARVFRGIARGIGRVVTSAFSLNSRLHASKLASESMIKTIAQTESLGTSAFDSLARAAKNYERTLRELHEREQDGLEDYAQKIDDIKSKILDAQNDIEAKTSARLAREKEDLEDLELSYAKTYKRINERIDDEMMNSEERIYDLERQKAKKLENINEKRAKDEEQMVEELGDLQEALSEATQQYQRDAIEHRMGLLQQEIDAVATKYEEEERIVKEEMDHEIEFVNKKHEIKMQRLNEEMEAEKAAYDKRKIRIEDDYNDDVAAYKKASEEKVAKLEEQLTREEKIHTRL